MQVVILCGGLGTRLREETEFRPKPMVPIGNRPVLWHIMKNYSTAGFSNFVLALGYKGEIIKDYFYNYELAHGAVTINLKSPKDLRVLERHDEEHWQVTLVETGEKTLKGARLKRVERYLDGDEFMVTYGDTVANVDVKSLLAFHRKHGKIATLTGITPASRFGVLKINGDQVESFVEKPKDAPGLVNGGFFVFNKKVFSYLFDRDDCDLEIGVLEKLALDGQLMLFKHSGFWSCMDTIRDVEYLNDLWNRNKAEWKVW